MIAEFRPARCDAGCFDFGVASGRPRPVERSSDGWVASFGFRIGASPTLGG
jgi:hypothetical protein